MLTIETTHEGMKDRRPYRRIIVNGQLLEKSEVSTWEDDNPDPLIQLPDGVLRVSIYDQEQAKVLTKYSFEDLNPYFPILSIPPNKDWPGFKGEDEFQTDLLIYVGRKDEYSIQFRFILQIFDWKKPYSVIELMAELEKLAAEHRWLEFEEDDAVVDAAGFIFRATPRSNSSSIEVEIAYFQEEIANIFDAVLRRLASLTANTLVTEFNFPASVKTSCEQYLVYFAQFLRDLGIEASTNIQEGAGRVLFSVIPKETSTALEKIKEALDIYLNLPQNPEFPSTVEQFTDVAVGQLKANVFFLKSQLAMAQAMLEAKDATIEALKLTAYQQRQMLTGSTSGGSVNEDENESEPIIGDTVHLTKYEGKFLKVDLPTILRRLKRSFGIDKDKE